MKLSDIQVGEFYYVKLTKKKIESPAHVGHTFSGFENGEPIGWDQTKRVKVLKVGVPYRNGQNGVVVEWEWEEEHLHRLPPNIGWGFETGIVTGKPIEDTFTYINSGTIHCASLRQTWAEYQYEGYRRRQEREIRHRISKQVQEEMLLGMGLKEDAREWGLSKRPPGEWWDRKSEMWREVDRRYEAEIAGKEAEVEKLQDPEIFDQELQRLLDG